MQLQQSLVAALLLTHNDVGVLGAVDFPMLEAGLAERCGKLLSQLAGLFQVVVALTHTAASTFQSGTVAHVQLNANGLFQNGAAHPQLVIILRFDTCSQERIVVGIAATVYMMAI